MVEFESARDALRAETAGWGSLKDQLVALQEQSKLLTREIGRLRRMSGQDENVKTLQSQVRTLGERIASLTADGAAAKARIAELSANFATFTDPADAINRMSDETPIALFPLRLETRFRTINDRQRLWVRVFPDDILVDSFQPEISNSEYANTSLYWAQLWRAGMAEDGHKAAWAALARSHGTGRAWWLTTQITPSNPDEAPPPPGADTHILIVRPAAELTEEEKTAVADYWSVLWRSRGAEADAALADLTGVVGPARAAELSAKEPVGLRDDTVAGDTEISPLVVFLDLPPHETLKPSQDDWVRGARAWMLPERFVLMAFKNGEQVLSRTGNPVLPEVQIGPDPLADAGEQLTAGEEFELPPGLKWTEDFQTAVAQGLGFDIDLTKEGLTPPFDRLFVLGLRVGSDPETGAQELTTLFEHHQRSRRGLSLLPQGLPTNNTEADTAGWTWWEPPEESFAHFFAPHPESGGGWRDRADGHWLAGMLGIDPQVLAASPHYHGRDQADARAMNEVLWPGTLGYYMEQMLEPVFSDADRERTREFFTRFVTGRGTVPLIRIGNQPYAFLPATRWSKVQWWRDATYGRRAVKQGLPDTDYLESLNEIVSRAGQIWGALGVRTPHVGELGPDAHQGLLDILGLHPASVRFFHRYSQSFTQYYNMLGFAEEPVSGPVTARAQRYVQAGLLALAELGWPKPPDADLPPVLEKILQESEFGLPAPLSPDELSETAGLAVTHEDGLNYLAWLRQAAETSHEMLRRQEGFGENRPRALLYHLVRHALDLGYVDTGLQLRAERLTLSEEVQRAARREPNFLGVAQESSAQSRWAPLYRIDPEVTGNQNLLLGEFIPQILKTERPYLNNQLEALERLEGATTARLERALTEHLDCLSYRLDAWRMGIQAVQLSAMRQETSFTEEDDTVPDDRAVLIRNEFGAGGIYIGAYGWLTDVGPDDATLTEVSLEGEISDAFDGDGPLLASDDNLGHIHAPSLDQAVTAAILRNGHAAHEGTPEGEALAIDLSSERVRLGQRMLEGVRNGQPVGALLGYQLERALHDEDGLFLDRLIYALREKFPLVGNRNTNTVATGTPITSIEARNVIDGDAFAEHIAETGVDSYPYALNGLPDLTDFSGPGLPSAGEIRDIVDGHVRHMRSIGDAVGDLALAESVYQVVRGNTDRAAGMLDAVSKGTMPPEPEVTATPRSGRTLTHRLALHLPARRNPGDLPSSRPRARGEPALAEWLEGMLPTLDQVTARVTWSDPDGDTNGSLEPNMSELGLDAADLFYMIGSAGAAEMPGIDALLIDHAIASGVPRDDAQFEVGFMPDGAPGLTLFELAPLVRALRGLLLGARPLQTTDFSLAGEARRSDDTTLLPRSDKAEAVRADLAATRAPIQAYIATLEALVGDGVDVEVAANSARDNIDAWIVDFAVLARSTEAFSLASASLEVGAQIRAAPFQACLQILETRLADWSRKADDFDRVMLDYGNLPGTTDDETREQLLRQAGQSVAVTPLVPLNGTIGALENVLTGARNNFDAQRTLLTNIRSGARRLGATLSAISGAEAAIAGVDASPLDLAPVRGQVLSVARELLQRAVAMEQEIANRVTAADEALSEVAGAAGDVAHAAVTRAIESILGKGFLALPEFTLPDSARSEWQSGWDNRADLMTHLTTGPDSTINPVEDWLGGVARVREKAAQLEIAILLSELLGGTVDLTPEPLQFPARSGDGWLAMRFPEVDGDGNPFELGEDKLLYNPVFAPGSELDPGDANGRCCGLLIDEWNEVVPGTEETTGLTFHFDRPNAEAPQAVLLVTPPSHREHWAWDDLVGTMHETLDFAAWRAVEPADLAKTALGPLLPATLASVTTYPITAALNFGITAELVTVLETSASE